MIKKIAHLADIHIENKKDRHKEYSLVFENLCVKLKKDSPDVIVIVGDLFDNFMSISNDAKSLAIDFINSLLKIAPVRITEGNHDTKVSLEKGVSKKVDSITPIAKLFKDKDFIYYNKTGFYTDDNIVWAVWHHADKISPWIKESEHERIKDKTYIDLFHDPIYGCKLPNNETGKDHTYVKISDFKGDYSLFGDIHLRQFYKREDKVFAAYSSSLIQQNFGEKIDKHGYLLWDIEKNEVHERDIETIFPYININIKEEDNIDYDNINIEIPNYDSYEKIRLKIWWQDKPSSKNKSNEKKVRSYFKNTYPKVMSIRFEKGVDNKNKVSVNNKQINEINTVAGQQKVFTEHLKSLGYESNIIEEVLELDNKINSRNLILNEENGINIELLQLKINNFRSYGDDIIINIDDLEGITQISGKNARGKTNILYSILYLFFAKIPSTEKREKFADNRFINNKRDLNYCSVTGILSIDSEIFQIERRTERGYKKDGITLKKCSTTVSYSKLDEQWNVIEDENGENKNLTKQIIERSIGDYESFFRKIFTDADTLNKVLSTDRAEFIDSLLNDTGIDVFDKKLNEYKLYKKEKYNSEEKIKLDVEEQKNFIEEINLSIENNNTSILNLENDLEIEEKTISKLRNKKEDLIKKLLPIDETLKGYDENNSKNVISDFETKKESKESDLENIDSLLENYPETFNEEEYNTLIKEKDVLKDSWYESKKDLTNLKYSLDSKKNDIDRVNTKIDVIKEQIESIKNSEDQLRDNLNSKIQTVIADGKAYKSQLDLKEKEYDSKKELLTLQKKNEEDKKICGVCNNDISEFYPEKSKDILESIKSIDNKILTLENSKKEDKVIVDLNNKIKLKREEYTTLKSSLDNKDYLSEITKKVKEKETETKELSLSLPNLKSELEKITLNIKNKESEIDNKQISLDEMQSNISVLEIEKDRYNKGLELKRDKEKIPLEIENLEHKILHEKERYDKFQLEKENIHKNELTNKNINETEILIEDSTKSINTLKERITDLNYQIKLNENKIQNINERIEKYEKQQREELIHTLYQNLLHRDGVPMTLLKNMIPEINNELYSMLKNMSFSLYFDENINLKMIDDSDNSKEQNVLDGSGMERSFIVLALKTTLQNISMKNKINLLILDEITGKLVEDSVENFVEMLHTLKQFVSRIFIIEHNHDINPDNVIEVDQNEEKISYLNMY